MNKTPLFTLSLLIVLGAVNTYVYIPALPAMSFYFHTAIQHTQSLVVLSLLAHCVSPLLFASLSNFKTRSSAIYLGLGLCLLGDLSCIISFFTQQFTLIISGIFLTSLGGFSGMSLALTIVRDQQETQLEKPVSIVMLSFAILPGIAIMLASAVLQHLPWPFVFVLLAAYHIFLMLLTKRLPTQQNHIQSLKKIFSLHALTQPLFWILVLLAGSLSGFIYSFAALSPHIAMQELKLSPMAFGLWSNIPSLGMLLGGLISIQLKQTQLNRLLWSVIILFFLCILTLTIGYWAHFFSVSLLFICVAFICLGIQSSFPAITSHMLTRAGDHASRSGIFTALHFLFASLIVTIANHLRFDSIVNLLLTYSLICCFLIVLTWLLSNNGAKSSGIQSSSSH